MKNRHFRLLFLSCMFSGLCGYPECPFVYLSLFGVRGEVSGDLSLLSGPGVDSIGLILGIEQCMLPMATLHLSPLVTFSGYRHSSRFTENIYFQCFSFFIMTSTEMVFPI